jgi:methylated-DNA-protein-cysteine methyltransferase-like protein
MPRVDAGFKDRVYELVGKIPKGRLMTYGQVAALCGNAMAAWEVGQIAHFGPEDLPWQRVVNKQGGLAKAYTWGGLEGHKKQLEAEGITVNKDFTVNVEQLIWWPDEKSELKFKL